MQSIAINLLDEYYANNRDVKKIKFIWSVRDKYMMQGYYKTKLLMHTLKRERLSLRIRDFIYKIICDYVLINISSPIVSCNIFNNYFLINTFFRYSIT